MSIVGPSIDRIQQQVNPTSQQEKLGALQDSGFADLLRQKSAPSAPAQELAQSLPDIKFSNHAVDRMKSRGISITQPDIDRLKLMIDKAEKKGAKETLVLFGDSAMIVNVKNKTVVTAMDRAMMKENVFTNIDSTVIL